MDDNANHALMIAFALFVFVIAMTATMMLFSQLTSTAEVLTYNADKTNYYDNVEVVGKEGIERYVNSETVIPTLYRYYKEHFCVKIYDATGKFGSKAHSPSETGDITITPVLVQILDVSLEGKVENAAKNSNLKRDFSRSPLTLKEYEAYSLNKIYNTKSLDYSTSDALLYMFGAPWLGSTENMKLRLDYLINGDAGYINNQFVDYRNHPFHNMLELTKTNIEYQFKENFISYSYTGETWETEDGDELVTGASSKDKIVITYTLVNIENDENKSKLELIK